MISEKIILNEERNVSLTCYRQDGAFHRPAVMIIPGGAYMYCSDREADPVAQAYLQAGYHAFILRYSVKENAQWPNPLNDYEQAMELLLKQSETWHIYPDKIAVVGFSAGGHLAAAAATMSKNRPGAAILGYAVAGQDVQSCNPSAPDTIPYVDHQTCPCFIFATRTDDVVPIRNSLNFMQALEAYQIAFESHIYAYGPHGFSTTASVIQDRDTHMCSRVKNWVSDSIGWLKDIFGDFKNNQLTEPTCARYATADYDAYLSLDCTLGHLLEHPGSAPMIQALLKQTPATPDMIENAKKMSLRAILSFSNVPAELVEQLDTQLSTIKNQ